MKLTLIQIPKKEFISRKLFNNYILHQFICNIFDESVQFEATDKNNVVDILAYSENEPKQIPEYINIKSKDFSPIFSTEEIYNINVNGNFVKNVSENGKNKKIPLIGEIQLKEYFKKNSEKFGIDVIELNVINTSKHIFKKNDNQTIHTLANNIKMKVRITNVDIFQNTLKTGIGNQKKFGFGLIKITK